MDQNQMSAKVHLSRSAYDKALNPEASKNYSLSIQLSLDGFSFCVFDNTRDKYAGIEVWDFQDVSNFIALGLLLKDFIPKIEWFKRPFGKTSVILETPVSTLIPNPLFQESGAADYLKFNHQVGLDDVVKHDYLSMLDAENIWAVPQTIPEIISQFFPDAKIHHHTSALIEALLLQNKNRESEEAVFVNVRKNWFDIIVLKGNNLIFSNSFRYRTKEDFIYFLIYVMEQLNLNPEKTDVTLLGEILKISSVYEMAYKYVRNISFASRSSDYGFSYVFDDIPGHFYYNLIHLHQCGL